MKRETLFKIASFMEGASWPIFGEYTLHRSSIWRQRAKVNVTPQKPRRNHLQRLHAHQNPQVLFRSWRRVIVDWVGWM